MTDLDELIRLRTELAIIRRFGRGADDRVVAVIEQQSASDESSDEPTPMDGADFQEMLQILRDAANPIVAETAGQIDAEYPQAAAAVQLHTIHQEAEAFHLSVAEQIRASGVDDAESLAESYLAAAVIAADQANAASAAHEGDDTVSESNSLPADAQDASSAIDEAEAVLNDAKAAAVPADTPLPEGAEDAPEEGAVAGDRDADDMDALLGSLSDEVEQIVSGDPQADEALLPDEAALIGDDTSQIDDAPPILSMDDEITDEAPAVDADAEDEPSTVDDPAIPESEDVDAMLDSLSSELDSAVAADDQEAENLQSEPESIAAEAPAGSVAEDPDLADALNEAAQTVDPVELSQAADEADQLSDATDPVDGDVDDLLDALEAEAGADPETTDEPLEATELGVEDMLDAADAAVSAIAADLGSEPEQFDDPSPTEATVEDIMADLDIVEDELLEDQLPSAAEQVAELTVGADADAIDDVQSRNVGGPPEQIPEEIAHDEIVSQAQADLPEQDASTPVADAELEHDPPTAELRAELQDVRDLLSDGLDRLARVLDRIDTAAQQAETSLVQANEMRQAAERARAEAVSAVQARKAYVEAQRQADEARDAARNADARAEAARQALENALAGQTTSTR
ncbi:MAG: hypothetical protein JXQ73_07595 [Phycisphaerae bacterium]|nr:hypothetical protein [Phycisphaerae bacterium]